MPMNDETPPQTLAVTTICARLDRNADPHHASKFSQSVCSHVRQIITRHGPHGATVQLDRLKSFVDCLSSDLPQGTSGSVLVGGFLNRQQFSLRLFIRPQTARSN